MEKKEFKYRLSESTKRLIEFTQSMVTNSISQEVKFLIIPNCREYSDHLNQVELNNLQKLNRLEGKLLNSDEVVSLLFNSGKVPLWINTEVYRSTKNRTTVKLICSRRLRDEKELNHQVDEFPPFHPLVPIPPWREGNEKFNINWQHQKLKRKLYYWKWKYNNEIKRTTPQQGAQSSGAQ